MNAFTFLPRKNHKNPPNKLIVTKFIRHNLPVFSNKAFLHLKDKLSSRIDNKTKNKKETKSCKPTKIFMTILGKSTPAECKMKFFHRLEKHRNCTVSN